MRIVATAITTSSAKNIESFRRSTRDILLASFTFDFHLAVNNPTAIVRVRVAHAIMHKSDEYVKA